MAEYDIIATPQSSRTLENNHSSARSKLVRRRIISFAFAGIIMTGVAIDREWQNKSYRKMTFDSEHQPTLDRLSYMLVMQDGFADNLLLGFFFCMIINVIDIMIVTLCNISVILNVFDSFGGIVQNKNEKP